MSTHLEEAQKTFDLFVDLVVNDIPFANPRFGDGEYSYMVPGCALGAWREIDFKNPYNRALGDRLWRCLQYSSDSCPNYYIGAISSYVENQFGKFTLDPALDTYTTVAADKMFDPTVFNLIMTHNIEAMRPLFNALTKKDVFLICNEKAVQDNTPFYVEKTFRVASQDAHIHSLDIIEKLKTFISANKIRHRIFVMCAGWLSNIIAHELVQFEPTNSWLDMGSIIDLDLGLGMSRKYIMEAHGIDANHRGPLPFVPLRINTHHALKRKKKVPKTQDVEE